MKRPRAQRLFPPILIHSALFWASVSWILCRPSLIIGATKQKSVLLFYDARSDMRENVVVDRTIRNVLNRESNLDLDIRSEYLEVSSLAKSDYPALYSWLRREYEGIRFEAIVAVGANTFSFVQQYDQELFQGAPIVHWGRRVALDDSVSGLPITGVVAPEVGKQVKSTLQFIRALQPDLERLVVRSEERRVGKECRSRWSPYH